MLKERLLKALTAAPINQLMSSLLGNYVTIYMLHRPQSPNGAYEGTNPEQLEQAIIYAKAAGFHFASIDELVTDALSGKKQQHPTLCFTLDDGYQDQLDKLVPVLIKHDCKPTLFVIADMVNGDDWPWDAKLAHAIWNTSLTTLHLNFEGTEQTFPLDSAEQRIATRRKLTSFAKRLPSGKLTDFLAIVFPVFGVNLATPPEVYQPATWNSLRASEQKGLTIGSHGCSHRVFSSLSDTQIQFELGRAKALLAQHLKSPSRVFCYPSGKAADFFPTHSNLLSAQDYIGSLNSIAGNPSFNNITANPFSIHRHSFPNTLHTFIRYSSWLEHLRSKFG